MRGRRPPPKTRRVKLFERILLLAGVFLFIVIGTIFGYGFYSKNIKPLREKALEIDSRVYTVGDYVKFLRFYGIGDVREEARRVFALKVERRIYEGEVLRRYGGEASPEEVEEVCGVIEGAGRRAGFGEDMIREIALAEVLRRKVIGRINEEIGKVRPHAKALAIVCASEKKAKEALKRLKEGEDFGEVVKKYCVDPSLKEKGGDMGWVPKGLYEGIIDDVLFSLGEGEISDIVKAPPGYWIIKVEKREEREISEEHIAIMRAKKFTEWINGKGLEMKVHLDEEMREWAIKKAAS